MALSASEYVFEKKKRRKSSQKQHVWEAAGQIDLDLGVSVDKLCFQMLSCTAGALLVKQKKKESLG